MNHPKTSVGLDASVIDRISLEQALIDVEIANARVVDLTERLTESADEIRRLHHELARTRSVVSRFSGRLPRTGNLSVLVRRVARAVLPEPVIERLRRLVG